MVQHELGEALEPVEFVHRPTLGEIPTRIVIGGAGIAFLLIAMALASVRS